MHCGVRCVPDPAFRTGRAAAWGPGAGLTDGATVAAVTDHTGDLGRIRRWADAGGSWLVLARGPGAVTVSLRRCDGGEEADRLVVTDPDALAYLARRSSSED